MTLRAILFAVDGVLAETEEVRREAFNRVFAEARVGWEWGRAVYAELLKEAGGGDMILAFVNRHLSRWRQTDDLIQLIAAMNRRHVTIYGELLEKSAAKLRPGMADLLCAAAREGVRLAIATEERTAHVASLLRANFGANGAAGFEVVTTREVDTRNFAHDIHSRTLEALSLVPEDCLAIESSPQGLRSALSAGIATVITWGIYPKLQDCADAIPVAAGVSPALASGAIVVRFDEECPADLLARLRHLHATLRGRCGVGTTRSPADWSMPRKELDHVGG